MTAPRICTLQLRQSDTVVVFKPDVVRFSEEGQIGVKVIKLSRNAVKSKEAMIYVGLLCTYCLDLP